MTDESRFRPDRRTAIKLTGTAGVTLAGLTGPAAAHGSKDHSSKSSDDETEDEERRSRGRRGRGRGKWCCMCWPGRRDGEGYERDHPHEDDETRWDDWEPDEPEETIPDEEEEEEEEDTEEEEPEEGESDDSDGSEDDGSSEDTDEGEDTTEDEDTDETADAQPLEPEPDLGNGGAPEDDETPEEPADDGEGEDTPEDTPDNSDDTEGEDTPEEGDDTNADEGTGDDSEDSDDSGSEPTLVTQIEERVHGETNAYRESQGEDPLDYSEGLAAVARAHSEDMLEQDYFSHDSPDGSGPGDRLDAAGVDCNGWAENIAWEQSSSVSDGDADSIADSTVEGWINSPGHRRNLVGNYDEEGIGVAVADGEVYVTQMFCSQ